MGCRCKKSACLKKYCECFEAGVTCGEKCKCLDCLNYDGSQALIDRRRKIKDHKGAEKALAAAESVNWNVPQHIHHRTTNEPPRFTTRKRMNSRSSARYAEQQSMQNDQFGAQIPTQQFANPSPYQQPHQYDGVPLPNAFDQQNGVQDGMEVSENEFEQEQETGYAHPSSPHATGTSNRDLRVMSIASIKTNNISP